MEHFDKEHLLDLHLNGKLSGETLSAFNKAVDSDAEFANKVKAGELAIDGLKSYYIEQRIAEIKKKAGGGTKIKRISWYRKPLAIAAGIAMIIIAGTLVYLNIGKGSLYQQYAHHPQLSITQMSTDISYDLSKAEKAFNKGEYTSAISELSPYLNQNPTDTLALFYQGISFLELDQFSDAMRIFDAISKGQSDFRALGTWYLALTYLKKGDTDQARSILQQISSDSEKYDDAQKLLEELD